MKNTDLRIGNLVKSKYSDVKRLIRVYRLSDKLKDIDSWEPIPLTNEILKDFGFIQTNNSLMFLPMPEITAEIHYEKHNYGNVITIQSKTGMLIPSDIDYVHQLQNLYHSLTGNELILQNESSTDS